MKDTDAFTLQNSDLNGFLFANIGVERSGMSLSVLSALARLDMDPWQEAARLAKLPRRVAADGLAHVISAMPASPWTLPDAAPIAARLVALLPQRGVAPTPGGGKPAADPKSRLRVRRRLGWLAAAAVVVVLSSMLTMFPGGAPQRAPVPAAIPAAAAAPTPAMGD